MTELDFIEISAQGSFAATLIWLITTICIGPELKRWLYQLPAVVLFAGLLLSYGGVYTIVAFLSQLLLMNVLTWRFMPSLPTRALATASCTGYIEHDRRKCDRRQQGNQRP